MIYFLFFVLILIFLGLYAMLVEPRLIRETFLDIETTKWPYKAPLKILVLSDFHIIWPWMSIGRLNKIVRMANALKPDIICLLGDFKGDSWFGFQVDPAKALEALENLSAEYGVFGVLGNHDLRSDDRWPQVFVKSTRIKLLRGEVVKVDADIGEFYVAGIDDLVFGKTDNSYTLQELKEKKPILFLSHNPDFFPLLPNNPALTLSGHTHGGQIRLPFIGSLDSIIPSIYGKKYDYGHIIENGKNLFVTSGLGMTTLPVRFFNRPEIALICLKKEITKDSFL